MKIPFSPPFINDEILAEVCDTLNSGWITTGSRVRALENMTAEFSEVPNCLCVNSATSALILVLHWYGIKEGDEVIIPAYTYAATALAVMHAGGTPVMVDVEDDFNISAERIAEKVTEKTKAIIPVDIAGWPCDYAAIKEVLNRPEIRSKFKPANDVQMRLGRILLMSDAAHSIGALYKNTPSARQSDITVYSYHSVKNVTTAEGGAILINFPEPFINQEIYTQLRLWSLNGQNKDAFTKTQAGGWRYDIVYPGFKMNMPDVLAAIGLVQLKIYKQQLLPLRRAIYELYQTAYSEFEWVQLPPLEDETRCSSFHLYPLRIKGITEQQRDQIIDEIAKAGVAVNVHFIPLPMLTVFKNQGFEINEYPVAFDNYSREISLPIYPQLSDVEVRYIIETVKGAYELVMKK